MSETAANIRSYNELAIKHLEDDVERLFSWETSHARKWVCGHYKCNKVSKDLPSSEMTKDQIQREKTLIKIRRFSFKSKCFDCLREKYEIATKKIKAKEESQAAGGGDKSLNTNKQLAVEYFSLTKSCL